MKSKKFYAIIFVLLILLSSLLLVACDPTAAEGKYTYGNQTIEISNLTKENGYASFNNVQTANGIFTSTDKILFHIYGVDGDIYSVKIDVNGITYEEKFNAKNGTFTFNGNTFKKV